MQARSRTSVQPEEAYSLFIETLFDVGDLTVYETSTECTKTQV